MKWTPRKAWERLRRAKQRRDIKMSQHFNALCVHDIPIRTDPRIEDDEWHMEQVLSASESAWQFGSDEPPVPRHPMCGVRTPMGTGRTWYIHEGSAEIDDD